MNEEPDWLQGPVVRFIHRDLITSFGGLQGIRDEGMLDSALARPINIWHCEQPPTHRLAAAYAYGLAMNHPFVDGNKRVAFLVSVLFLELNSIDFSALEVDSATTFLELAAGELGEEELAAWFQKWSSSH